MERPSGDATLVPIGVLVDRLRQDYPDVSHSSLRFLEREGLITPIRTPGGHRLYAEGDIRRIRQIKDWQAQRLSLDTIRHRLVELSAVRAPEELAHQFLEQALTGDLGLAQRTVRTARDLGVSLDILFTEVLRPALWELGERWACGEVSVAQEKEVSHVVRDLIAELGAQVASAGSTERGGVVAACVAGEHHELGLLMVSGLLRARGVRVSVLGADVASDYLVDAVTRRRPQAVLLSATRDAQLPALRTAAEVLRAAGVVTLVLAGGQAVERHPQRVIHWGITPVMLSDLDQIDGLARRLRSED